MPRHYTHYWKNSTWDGHRAAGEVGMLLDSAGSNVFRQVLSRLRRDAQSERQGASDIELEVSMSIIPIGAGMHRML
jgi:hypothetical protein